MDKFICLACVAHLVAQNQIRIDDEAYRYLNSLQSQGETFNDAVHKLMQEYNNDSRFGGMDE